MKKFIYKHKTLWISIAGAALIIVFMGSCRSTQKYGCGSGFNKRMTWDKMVRHINRP